MFVSKGAVEMIKEKRRIIFLSSTLQSFMLEAEELGITKSELKVIIEKYKEI